MTHSSSSSELGSVVLFEHVNLRITDHRLATAFFVEGLGLTRDPLRMVGTRNMWVNVGQQQLHLPIGSPTPLAGEIGLVVPDLEAVGRQLEEVAPLLAGTPFSVHHEHGTLLSITPWGHRIRIHSMGELPGRQPYALAYVEFWVTPDTAAGIAGFYREVLGCPVELDVDDGPTTRVAVGPHQTFRFREQPSGRMVPHDNHVAVYLTRYHAVYAALERLGVITEADAGEQFRFCNIVDPASGRLLHAFEHEMRSLYHPDYRRPLVNRVPVPYRVD